MNIMSYLHSYRPDTKLTLHVSLDVSIMRTSSVSYIRRVDEVSWLYFSYTKMRRL